MKLITYLDGHPRVGAVIDDRVVDLGQMFDSMQTLIERGEPALDEARSIVGKVDPVAAIAEVELLAPIPHPRRNVFCMGWNYLTHFEEGQGKRGDRSARRHPPRRDGPRGRALQDGRAARRPWFARS